MSLHMRGVHSHVCVCVNAQDGGHTCLDPQSKGTLASSAIRAWTHQVKAPYLCAHHNTKHTYHMLWGARPLATHREQECTWHCMQVPCKSGSSSAALSNMPALPTPSNSARCKMQDILAWHCMRFSRPVAACCGGVMGTWGPQMAVHWRDAPACVHRACCDCLCTAC